MAGEGRGGGRAGGQRWTHAVNVISVSGSVLLSGGIRV